MDVIILSGSGRYQDRWHDFAATSVEVARALEPLGLDVAVRSFKPQGVAEVEQAELLVVNAGSGAYSETADGPEDEWVEAFETLRRHRARGKPVLALHASANSLDGLAEWPQWIGGRWVDGRSTHPPIGECLVQVRELDHPVAHDLDDIELVDERYSSLDVHPGSQVLVTHRHEDQEHPLVWTTDQDGARAVYDALGHDVRSYRSPGRLDLLRREVRWLLGEDAAAGEAAGA